MYNKTIESKGLVTNYSSKAPMVDFNAKNLLRAQYESIALYSKKLDSDYRRWAIEDVHVSDKEQIDNGYHNDKSYTMSMLMNCMSPLMRDVSVKNLLGAWVSFALMKSINPDFENDLAHVMSGIRTDMVNISKDEYDKVPSFMKNTYNRLTNLLLRNSIDATAYNIEKRLSDNSLDSIKLSAHELAMIKVNFSEQFYVDIRQYDTSTVDGRKSILKSEKEFSQAMEHIKAIAKNNNIPMEELAENERFIVGLKIFQDKNYANVYSETQCIYGVTPIMDAEDSSGAGHVWSGQFKTPDEHRYFSGTGDVGAFTVRMPLSVLALHDDTISSNYMKEMSRYANQYAAMVNFINDKEYGFDEEFKHDAKLLVDDLKSEYLRIAESAMLDDNLYKDEIERNINDFNTEFELSKNKRNQSFIDEILYVAGKKEIQSLGIDFVPHPGELGITDLSSDAYKNQLESHDAMMKIANRIYTVNNCDGCDGTDSSNRTYEYIKKLHIQQIDNPKDLAKLFSHVATNMEQAMAHHQRYGRTINNPDEEKTKEENNKEEEQTNDCECEY